MKQQKIYVQAAEQISIQQPLSLQWMDEPILYDEPFVRAINPVFRDYISGSEVRRMGSVLKRSLVTGLKLLADTGVEHPDAIITGTSFGCMEYTEKFLDSMIENGEEMLSPTHFMQSTHNTVGSTLGIYTKTHGYNTTYSQGSTSFDWAVLDAWMQLRLGKISTALVGGHDEMIDSFFQLLTKIGYVGQEGMTPCGEVSMSMLLTTSESDAHLCELAGICVGNGLATDRLARQVDKLLRQADLTMADLSAVMTGINGHAANDQLYGALIQGSALSEKPHLHYKHIFGENYTVSALGLYAAAHSLKRGEVPSALYADGSLRCAQLQNLLLVNLSTEGEYSLILLKR